jgi:predicted butyrate kinase (DUF1464 family)
LGRSPNAMRVAGIDPGTLSFDVCGLDDGTPFLDLSVASDDLGRDPTPLVAALRAAEPLDLVLGPSGYGLPLTPASRVGERELRLMLLTRQDEAAASVGIGGMRRIVEALVGAGLPLVFAPGVIHLPTVPAYRKANRIDIGTADKLCAAALGIYEQAARLGCGYDATSFILLELGGAFSAALAIDGGRIVDGLGGSSGPIGLRAAGALDGEAAYLLGTLSKQTIFSGGVCDLLAAPDLDPTLLGKDPRYGEGLLALVEGAAKAALALSASLPRPREILLSGRLAALPRVEQELAARLAHLAPLLPLRGLGLSAKAAAQGAALLADGLAGGSCASLVAALRLREAAGTALDYLYLRGADAIRL